MKRVLYVDITLQSVCKLVCVMRNAFLKNSKEKGLTL